MDEDNNLDFYLEKNSQPQMMNPLQQSWNVPSGSFTNQIKAAHAFNPPLGNSEQKTRSRVDNKRSHLLESKTVTLNEMREDKN